MRGFSLVELLVALTVCLLLFGTLAGVVVPARAAFAAAPTAIDQRQRARTALDAIATAVRSANQVTPFADAIQVETMVLDAAQTPPAFVIETNTFELEAQADGSRTLVRIPASGVAQPMVDGIVAIGVVPVYADDTLKRIDVWLRVKALDDSRPESRMPDRLVQVSIALRNAGVTPP